MWQRLLWAAGCAAERQRHSSVHAFTRKITTSLVDPSHRFSTKHRPTRKEVHTNGTSKTQICKATDHYYCIARLHRQQHLRPLLPSRTAVLLPFPGTEMSTEFFLFFFKNKNKTCLMVDAGPGWSGPCGRIRELVHREISILIIWINLMCELCLFIVVSTAGAEPATAGSTVMNK